MANLLLHCGARHIDRHALDALPEPQPQGPQHRPIQHGDLVEYVENTLDAFNLQVTDRAFGISENGMQLFGVMDLKGRGLHAGDDWGFQIGLRQSQDRTISPVMLAGSHVWICDNLAYTGQIEMVTRATTFVLDRLPQLVEDMVRRTIRYSEPQKRQFDAYHRKNVSDIRADAAITAMVREGVINPSEVGKVIEQWDEPKHDEFAEARNVWRLFNAATETLKPRNPEHPRLPNLAPKTITLHRICDELADLPLAA